MEIVWLYIPVFVNLSLLYNTKSTAEKSLVIFEIGACTFALGDPWDCNFYLL